MKSEKWHEERRSGIGGSDCGAVCGVSKWKTPYQVYADKLGIAEPQEENPAMEWGNRLEPVIRQKFADDKGEKVLIVPELVRHPKYPHIFSHIDGLIEGKSQGIEVKTARNAEGWGESGTDEIPIEYIFQCQHNALVFGLEVVFVPVLIATSDFRVYEVPADKELQEIIIQTESDFWEKNVKAQIPPEPINLADIKHRWRLSSVDKAINADIETFKAWDALHSLITDKNATEAKIESLQAQIMVYMKDADALLDSQGLIMCTWRSDKKGRQSIDTKKFKESLPEIYNQFLRESEPIRRFLIKGK